MAAVANCSRRLLARPSTALVLLPARPRPSSRPGFAAPTVLSAAAAARPTNMPSTSSSPTSSFSSSSAAFFSTSSAAYAKGAPQHIRAGKKYQNAKRKRKNISRGKPILPGERKAYRKRIVLSNSNALEVPDLEELTAQHLLPSPSASSSAEGHLEVAQSAEGRILALPDAVVDQLRAVEAFKPTQNFHLFRRPSLLVRSETVALAGRLQREVAQEKKTMRLVIDGERIVGKSTLLLQAMTHGFLNDWLVFNIPEAHELTTATTDYSSVPNSDPPQYVQPSYTYRLLQAVLAANSDLLARFTTARAHDDLANPVAAGSTLQELVASAKEADHAWPVFQALWSELVENTGNTALPRPPILFAIDGLAHIMRVSDYRSPAYELIHAHDLVLVRLLVDALGGATQFPHGAAILAATTRGNVRSNASVDLALAQRRVEQTAAAEATDDKTGQSATPPTPDPYFRGYDERVAAALRTVEVQQLKGVSKTEARALLEYWAASGMLRDRVDERTVTASWTLAGNGVVGELERAVLLSLPA